MSEELRVATFGELVTKGILEIGDGYRAKLEELGGNGPIFLRAGLLGEHGFNWGIAERFDSEIISRLQTKFGKPGDTLVTTKGNSIGRTGYVPVGAPSFVYSPHLSYWRSLDFRQLSPRFLYYWSLSREFAIQLQAMANSTDMAPYLSLTDQRRLRITLPDIATQDAVGDILRALDDKFSVNHRVMATASDLITAAYVRVLQVSGVPLSLSEVVEFDFGAPFSSSSFTSRGKGLPLLRIRDLRTWRPGIWTTERIPGDVVVQSGDVVAGMDAEFRPTFWLGAPALLNQRVLRARPRMYGAKKSFVREVLRVPLQEIERHKSGTTVIHLNKRDLEMSTVCVPTTSAVQAFEMAADPLREKIVATAKESAILIELRDTILPRLLSGEFRLQDVERIVEGAT